MALLMKLGQDSTHRQLLGYKFGSRRRVQARFDSQRRHHAGRITSTGGLRVFRHSDLLSDWKRRGRDRRLDMVYLLGEAR
jgi:hypothetical protein